MTRLAGMAASMLWDEPLSSRPSLNLRPELGHDTHLPSFKQMLEFPASWQKHEGATSNNIMTSQVIWQQSVACPVSGTQNPLTAPGKDLATLIILWCAQMTIFFEHMSGNLGERRRLLVSNHACALSCRGLPQNETGPAAGNGTAGGHGCATGYHQVAHL